MIRNKERKVSLRMTDDDGAEQALLFQERGSGRKAITREPLQLPPSDLGWELVQSFTLGVQQVMPIDMDPEPVCEGSQPTDTTFGIRKPWLSRAARASDLQRVHNDKAYVGPGHRWTLAA